MNEIPSNNLSEKCPREIGIVFMRYTIKMLLSESIDFAAQCECGHGSLHQPATLGEAY